MRIVCILAAANMCVALPPVNWQDDRPTSLSRAYRPNEVVDGWRTRANAFVVLEDDICIRPRFAADALCPRRKRRLVVVESVKSQIAPRCRAYEGRRKIGLVDHAHRNIALAKRVVDAVVEPAFMPELDGEATIGRQHREKSAQPVDVLLHVRRKLEQDRPETCAERRRGLE